MQDKLTWNAIGFEQKFQLLLTTVNESLNSLPHDHLRDFQKLNKFRTSLESIIEKNKAISSELIPKIEKLFRLKFKTPEMIFIALTRPSIRNLLENIAIHYDNGSKLPFSTSDFNELVASGDAANVLALLGDSVLDLAIIKTLWDSSLAKVGDLSKRRSDLVNNRNLAKLCDKLRLFDYRILGKIDPSAENSKEETILHEKGTLIESLFGVIYLEYGLDEIGHVIPFLQ